MNRTPREPGNAGRCCKQKSKRRYAPKRRYHGGKKKQEEQSVVIDDRQEKSDDNDPVAANENVSVEAPVNMEVVECVENTAAVSKTKPSLLTGLDNVLTVKPTEGRFQIDYEALFK